MKYTKIKEINNYVSKSVNPAKMSDTVFEMYSVPAFETGHPEYLYGKEIASSKIEVKKDDILLCKINPRINRVWIVLDESDNQSIASSEWIVIRTDDYNPEFLAWYFRTSQFQQRMMSEVTGIGGSLTRAQPKRVAEYPVPVFDRKRQDRIAIVLNKIANIIDLRKKELKVYDELIKARFVEMFGDPVRNEKNWPLVTLGDVAEIRIGPFGTLLHKEDYIVGGHALVNPSHIVDGRIRTDEKLTISDEKYDELSVYHLLVGDIVLGRRGEMGRCAVVYQEGLLCGTGSMIIRPTEKMKPYFLQNIISNPAYKKIIEDKAVGVTMMNLNVPIVSSLLIPLLPIDMQEHFITFMQQTDKSKVAVQKTLEGTQFLFDSLMQKYFG